MKPGEKVTIYEDPFTEEKPEGDATLLKLADRTADGLEFWWVRFDGEEEAYRRLIRPR